MPLHLPLTVLAVAFLVAPIAHAQDGSVSTAEAEAHQARVEVAKVVHSLEGLLAQIHATQESARSAMDLAESAKTASEKADLESAAKVARETHEQLRQLAEEMAVRLAVIQQLRDKGAREVPPALADSLGPLREDIEAAAKLPTLPESVTALEKIETRLTSPEFANNASAQQVLGLARYRLGDTLRRRGVQEAGMKQGDRRAEATWGRACRVLYDVLAGADNPTTPEGSSIHAAALRRIVQIEAAQYERNRRMAAQQPTSSHHASEARKHRQAAEEAFERLQRVFPDAVLGDGQRAVDAAREDVRRLSR